MDAAEINLDESWKAAIHGEFEKPYLAELCSFLTRAYDCGKIYPPESEIFAALNITSFDKVKVVVIGQDPYHGPGQANGLCFSVRNGVKLPPSLRNIFKELRLEFGFEIPTNGDLSAWAMQGVLLLNSSLTVEDGNPGSHQSKWKPFTDAIINKLAAKNNLVFLAWGNEAQKSVTEIDTKKHCVLKSAHPSPFSYHRGFRGNGHFEAANEYLRKTKQKAINWQV